ncbi:MAG TPA: response regulator [Steroidobacteraceae bacterium]|nr:response regulator [Steroidobacteraceae bacterium]
MSPGDEEFLRQLRATFRVEAAEHLQAIASGLVSLEKSGDAGDRPAIVETVFRAAHSLKGAARAVDFNEIETLCQSLESLFALWKRDLATLTTSSLDAAHLAHDRMAEAINGPAARAAPPAPTPAAAPLSPARSATPPAPVVVSADPETVRVAVRALDDRLLEAEELLSAKIAGAQRAAELDALSETFDDWRQEWSHVQAEVRALRRGGGALAEFLEWNHEWLRALESRVMHLRRGAEQDRLAVGKLVDDLLANSKKLLMLPVATLTAGFPKLARDLTRELGKDAELVIRGEDVQVDKRILEEMKDPLVHVLRNAIDHGLEDPETRRRAGKPPRATITLAVTPVNGSHVEFSVSDDGAGIDRAAVKAQAVARGLLTPEAAAQLDDAAVLALVFETDLSTSAMITQVSGRGLGLAIVREKTEKLGGRLGLDSTPGVGTTLHMTLPLTLATFRGVLVEAARRTFVVPTAQVERVTRFRSADVRTVEGRETLSHNGRALALASLAQVLDLPPAPAVRTDSTPALILGTGADRIAFAVDAVIDEREVLVKRLTKPLVRVRNIAGATVLGDGAVAPILSVTDLLRSARRAPALRLVPRATQTAPATSPSTAKRVLVAEDSITSRMLLKGILESAGYDVKTAVDGIDAFTQLRSGQFDVLVSDVEMPRLNGFDLTSRVRADAALRELPVVLVTALASREDRERGIEVGANAYLVKSNLDQSNLLEALQRLA